MTRVLTVACLADIAGQVVADSLAADLPDSVVVRHTMSHDDGAGGTFVRSLYSLTGLVEATASESTACCVSCSVREDAVETVARLCDGPWQNIVVSLPPTVAPGAFVSHLAAEIADGRIEASLAAVIAAVEPDSLESDLLDDRLLREHGLALGDNDGRSVGEALSAIIDYADIVATPDLPRGPELELLRHTAPSSTRLWLGMEEFDAAAAAALHHDIEAAEQRLDPLTVDCRHVNESGTAWTIELASSRPFHPQRLLDQIELLGGGRIRARGCFWVPTRPGQICGWYGAGGQLYIGVTGEWGTRSPRTRLLITGVDHADRDRVSRAFADCLLTGHEAHLTEWPTTDGLEPWLG
ncbi:MAG: GTP-binding protein [Propionibacteriaceae bacterium]|nr:GTP-binding protein [Propionibacteriaceae bacterium]